MAAAIALPTVARGAGMEVPENGAYILARGGTSASMSGTAYSLQFNPAGLADVENNDFRIDARLVKQNVTFKRENRDNNGVIVNFNTVSNAAYPFLAPSLMGAYRFETPALQKFVFGFGVFGPPGVGKYKYPGPGNAYFKAREENMSASDVDAATGQRYSLISNSNTILLPTIGLGWRPLKELALGMSVSFVSATISFEQAIAGKSTGGFESTTADGIAELEMKDSMKPTFAFGVLYSPLKNLTVGLTFKPPVKIEAKGDFKITPPAGMDFEQYSKAATLKLTLAPQTRLGATYKWSRYSLSLEGVWQGWSAYKDLIIDASEVKYSLSGKIGTVGVKTLPKNWQDSYGVRLGFTGDVIEQKQGGFGLQGHLGGLYETSAIPSTSQAIDTVNGDRFGFSAGATVAYGEFSATLAGMIYPTVTITSTDSEAKRSVADSKDPDDPPVYVGRGTYTSNVWIASLGIAYTPGKSAK
jgi:long-subunit fatty acid transport protein